jgi:hypothetical protein
MTTWAEGEDTCFVTSKTSWKKNNISLKLMRNGVHLLSSCSVQLTKYNTARHFTTIRSSFNQQHLPHSELRKNNTCISDFKAKLASQPSIKKKWVNLVIRPMLPLGQPSFLPEAMEQINIKALISGTESLVDD